MSDARETVDDIIDEMLGARTEFPFIYLMGEADTPAVVDFSTKEIIEPRKINIRRVTVSELAERLKAAHKRECEKMREALEKIAHYDDDDYGMDDHCCADGHICADIARQALAPATEGETK